MAGNFAALIPLDLKFLALKDLNPFKTVLKVQEAKSILRLDFTLSKYPHFDSTFLVKVRFSLDLAVPIVENYSMFCCISKYLTISTSNPVLISASISSCV